MRARQIKPGFFKNEILAECSPHARLLFAGLWQLGDREGRLEDRPARIKAEVFPYETVDAEKLLCELASKTNGSGKPEFIIRYLHPEGKFIQIVNFDRHQNPHIKEAASTIPAPDSPGASTVQAGKRHKRAGLTPSSPILDSPIPDSPLPESGASTGTALFQTFYDLYPRHEARAAAEKAWSKILEAQRLECLERTPAWIKAKEGTEKQFLPLPATYLNGKRWRDVVSAPTEKVRVGGEAPLGRGGMIMPSADDLVTGPKGPKEER